MLRKIGMRAFFWPSLLLLAALFGGCEAPTAIPTETRDQVQDDTALEHALKHLDAKYVCPMHPQIVRNEPGNCPICGMDLVKKQIDDAGADERPAVAVSGEIIQSMGVRTAQVERGTLWKFIRTVGRVDYDETRLVHVHPRANGWMEQLKVRAVGDHVSEGEILGQLYSPDILSAQVDFLIALKQYGKQASRVKVDKARNLLRLLDVPEYVIEQIEKKGETRNTVPVLAPMQGVVTDLGMREGMYVSPQSIMVTIADLERVWVMVDVFENQLDWLKPGLQAEIRLPALPGKVWNGEVDFIYPELDVRTRSLKVRLSFPNPDALLRPNMFAEVVIYGGAKKNALSIPREALIVTGERKSVVKALGEGRFQPIDVVTGMQRSGRVEILSGLEQDDEIVVSGQFLIDSESSLKASFLRMSEVSGPDR